MIYHYHELTQDQLYRLKHRSGSNIIRDETFAKVSKVMEDVRKHGDRAILAATEEFDHVDLKSLEVSEAEFEHAWHSLDPVVIESLQEAIQNHFEYNKRLSPPKLQIEQLGNGILAGRKAVPLKRVGLYVPSGKGAYPSSFVTIAVPAIVAGVPDIQVVVPPNPDGSVDAAILAVARILGIRKVFRGNGVACIAAYTYGTDTIKKVDKIVGPGGPYIIAAQMKAQLEGVAVGLLFGPSECMIIADDSADPELVAADLINEAEHGMESSAILLTHSMTLARSVEKAIREQLRFLPEIRRKYAEQSLFINGGIIVVEDMDKAIEVANDWGNEHIQIVARDPWEVANRINSASELLIGQHTTFSAISYAIGVPACLPTGQFSKIYSGVTVDTYLRYSAVTQLDQEGLQHLSKTISTLAKYEGFPANDRSIEIRKSKGILKDRTP